MVTNASPEFFVAKKRFEEAKTPEEKLDALYLMLKEAPKHKGASNLLLWIRKEISKYKKLVEEKNKKSSGKFKIIEKSGDILISIIGVENSGKSYFLKKFTNANVEDSEIPFSTINPAVGTLFYKGVYYQFIEIPSTFKKIFRNILAISDFYIIIIDTRKDIKEQLNKINKFSESIIQFSEEEKNNYIIVYNKFDHFENLKIEQILEKILEKLDLIRVFPINSEHCVILKKNSTIKDFIEKLNKKFLNYFEYAKIFRKDKIIRGGLSFKLEDGDLVELKIKLS
ncbi:MAG: GTPase [Nanopusillaceae archaeon]